MYKIIFVLILNLLITFNPTFGGDESSKNITLRSDAIKLTFSDIKKIVLEKNFFDSRYNPNGNFLNKFVDNGDGTITDHASGLMWDKEGSSKKLIYRWAKKYVKSLNSENFAGYDSWRFPTTEELYSILQPVKHEKLFCDPSFLCHDSLFWSIDSANMASGGWEVIPQKISVDFETGTSYFLLMLNSNKEVPIATGEGVPCLGIIRAVRTID